ncbi:hypothetical protein MOMA_01240 [Moraxella macacae 0408225]|uniref:DUF4230 domain-containing protein n=1 Tax=Moraxella macacae 0408225 TaxID=1230338 RepID=L2F891_9GAMM|nr:DUF4230 domain-containing protein [Moraxella macacae]ELA08991.1 hypothetical protein MOMA_01240 [Moraxella macacae 0408225]
MTNKQPIIKTNAEKRLFWVSVILFALLSALMVGFYTYQKNTEAKIDVLTTDGVISKIQSLNRLQTVVYNVDTVITAQKQGNWYTLWQDEQKGLFVAHGRVQAGIDLNQLTAENIAITPLDKNNPTQSVTITLPPAQVFETYLDNIEVYDIQTGVFGMIDIDPQIFSQAQAQGKAQVLKTACKSDMLKLATDNAQKQVAALFALANVNVTVSVNPPKSCG